MGRWRKWDRRRDFRRLKRIGFCFLCQGSTKFLWVVVFRNSKWSTPWWRLYLLRHRQLLWSSIPGSFRWPQVFSGLIQGWQLSGSMKYWPRLHLWFAWVEWRWLQSQGPKDWCNKCGSCIPLKWRRPCFPLNWRSGKLSGMKLFRLLWLCLLGMWSLCLFRFFERLRFTRLLKRWTRLWWIGCTWPRIS